jgi:hypothetical protein
MQIIPSVLAVAGISCILFKKSAVVYISSEELDISILETYLEVRSRIDPIML